MRDVPQVVCYPRDDIQFAERVHRLLEGSRADEPFGAAVQILLRAEYPLAVVHPRHPLAALDGRQIWYAFRDGSIVPIADVETP